MTITQPQRIRIRLERGDDLREVTILMASDHAFPCTYTPAHAAIGDCAIGPIRADRENNVALCSARRSDEARKSATHIDMRIDADRREVPWLDIPVECLDF
jgi:hypothetical protein